MRQSDLMISVSGVRGVIPTGLSATTIVRYALAFGAFCAENATVSTRQQPVIIISRDNRPTGPMMLRLVTGALMAQGFRVLDLGIAPTPSLKAAVVYKKAAGGIMLSASHNPLQWNAFKFVASSGDFLGQTQMDRVLAILNSADFATTYAPPGAETGAYRASLLWQEHIKEIIENMPDALKVRKSRMRVALDANAGAVSIAGPRLLKKLNCKVYPLFCVPAPVFPRPPEPVAASLERLSELVRRQRCDVGFATDPDGDRLSLVTADGVPLGEEYTLPLAMMAALPGRPGAVVVNLSTSSMNDQVAAMFDRPIYRSRVGEANVVALMRARAAAFGGEGNGGVIDPRISSYGRDSLAGMALILSLMAGSGKSLATLAAALRPVKMVKRAFAWEAARVPAVANRLEREFGAPAEVNAEDGLRLAWADHWAHIRPSNTEPVVRVIYETPSGDFERRYRELLDELDATGTV